MKVILQTLKYDMDDLKLIIKTKNSLVDDTNSTEDLENLSSNATVAVVSENKGHSQLQGIFIV